MDDNLNELKKKIAKSDSEAIENTDHLQKDTNVSIPTEEAVKLAKEWVEENEK